LPENDSMADPLVLEYELTPDDYGAFWSYHFQHSRRLRSSTWKAKLIIPGIWLGILLLGGLGMGELVVWLVLTLAWIGGITAYLRWAPPRTVRKAARDTLARGCVGPHRLSIDERGVLDATPFYESRLFWPAIDDVADAPDHVLLYSGECGALMVPKRAFVSELEVGNFVEGINDLRRLAASHPATAG
jgi:hypothetical protein